MAGKRKRQKGILAWALGLFRREKPQPAINLTMNERIARLGIARAERREHAEAVGGLTALGQSFADRMGGFSGQVDKAATLDPPGTDGPMHELGGTGLRQYSGILDEEFLPQLRGKRAIQVYREMSENDATIGSILFAIQMLIRQIDWRVEPAGDTPADLEKAKFLSENIDDMSETWTDMIAEILSFLPFGFSLHEPVFKRRLGASRDPKRNSKHSDGRIGWQKIPGRSQETIDRWVFDEDTGEMIACEQVALPRLNRVTIPASRFLLFRTTTAKGNPEGRSVLRTAYRAWFYKRRIEEVEGVGIERDLAGMPIAGMPIQLFSIDATPDEKAMKAAIEEMVRNVRRDSQEGITIPLEYDENNNLRYTFDLLTTGGRRQFDTTKIVDRYDKRLAMVVLADFILLGQQSVGSFALADSKTALFASAIKAWAMSIEQTFNRQAIPQLFALNVFPETDALPELRHGDIESVDIALLAEAIAKLVTAGAITMGDEETENHLRKKLDLPERPEDLEPEPPPEPTDDELLAMAIAAGLLPDPAAAPMPPAPTDPEPVTVSDDPDPTDDPEPVEGDESA